MDDNISGKGKHKFDWQHIHFGNAQYPDWDAVNNHLFSKCMNNFSLATRLFDENKITLGQGAKITGMSIEGFIEELGLREIPLIRYSSVELEEDLKEFLESFDKND